MVDIVFVFSVIVLSLDDNFRKMKFLLDEIINSYSLFVICYSIIIFGKILVVEFDFGGVSDFMELREIL